VHPYLLDWGTRELPFVGPVRLAVPTYGVIFAMALVGAWWWFARRVARLGLSEERVWRAAFAALLVGIVGAKLGLVWVEWRAYLANPVAILGTVRSAGVLLFGVGSGSLAFYLYARKHGLPFWRLADAAAAPVAAAQAAGRLGCLAAGCCYGVPASNPRFAVSFVHPDSMVPAELRGVPLVPIQLIQMANDLLLAGVLVAIGRRPGRAEGTVFWSYVLLYGITRTILERWRGDDIRGIWFGGRVSTSQILGAGAAVVAAVVLFKLRSRGRDLAAS